MKFISYLQEEHYDTVTVVRGRQQINIDVYLNPTSRDLMELKKIRNDINVRFLIDILNKNIYAFHYDVLHDEVIHQLKIGTSKFIYGIGIIFLGKIEISGVYYGGEMRGEDWTKWSVPWCKRYFTNDLKEYIRKYVEG